MTQTSYLNKITEHFVDDFLLWLSAGYTRDEMLESTAVFLDELISMRGPNMTEEQIKHMRDRFLGWYLPIDFSPDNGVTFEPIGNKGHSTAEYTRRLSGTNLLDATQADAMIRYMIEGMP